MGAQNNDYQVLWHVATIYVTYTIHITLKECLPLIIQLQIC